MKNNYIKSERMWNVCLTYVYRMFYVISILFTIGIGQSWADVDYVVGCAASNPNNYTVKLDVNRQTWGWYKWDMSNAGLTFEGKKLYYKKYETQNGCVNDIYFHYYDGNTEKTSVCAYTGSGTQGYANQIYNYDGTAWYSKMSMSQSKVYFDASNWSQTDIYMVIAHVNYQGYYAMTNVAHTKLYYTNASLSWSDAMGLGVVGRSSYVSGGTNWINDIASHGGEYTGLNHYQINNNDASAAYLIVNNGASGQQPSNSYNASYQTLLNSTQTIQSWVSTNSGSTYSQANSKATITITSYAMTSQGTSGATSSNGTLSTTANSTTVTAARTATTTLSVGAVADGYVFEGWYNSSNQLLSSNTSYTYYPTGATTIRARFKNETSHSVTHTEYCTTTSTQLSTESVSVGEVSYKAFEAPEKYGYTFVNWTYGNGISVKSGDSNTSNPIHVKTLSSGTYTLQANYEEELATSPWYVAGESSAIFGGWGSSGRKMLRKTGHSAEKVFYYTIDATKVNNGSTDDSDLKFKIYNSETDAYRAGSGGYWITRANYYTNVSTDNTTNMQFCPDAYGTYEFKLDCESPYSETTPRLTVTYGTKYQVNFGKRTGGNTVTAKYKNTTSMTSGQYVISGSSVTFAQTALTGYTFAGWYSASAGGSKLSDYSTYTTTITAAKTVYSTYTPNDYVINLNRNTGGSDGSVTATYNSSATKSFTEVTKTGYNCTGYWTDASGGTKVVNADGSLVSYSSAVSAYLNSDGTWKKTTSTTLYAQWTPKTYTGSNNLNKTIGDVNGQFTATYNATTIAINTAPTKTGYDVEGYYKTYTTSPDTWTTLVATPAGALQTSTGYTDGSKRWTNDGNVTLYTKWTAHTYTVTLTHGEGGSGSGSATIVYDATAYATFSHNITQTGYHIEGWYDNGKKLKVLNDDGTFAGSSVSGYISSSKWCKASDCTLQAWWDPNNYTVTLDKQSSAPGHSSDGDVSNQSVYYNTALPSISGTAPTAINGWAFMGFYTATGGEGVQVIDANLNWVASVDGYTDADSKWKHADNVTLYAYYKKAEITGITFSTAGVPGSMIAPSTSTTATATISPTPTGTTTICWRILHSNGNPLEEQPTFDPEEGAAVSFTTSATSGSYLIEARLRLGSGCSGTVLDSVTAVFQVAGDHDVTVQYKDASGNTIKASETVTGRPLAWSSAIEAPEIFGYTFSQWEAVDGVTISTDGTNPIVGSTTSTRTIYIKAVYDGRIVAKYNKKDFIYFKNTLGWDNNSVYVYFYKNGGYWDDSKGAGATGDACIGKGKMSLVDGETDILYWDYGAGITGGATAATKYIAFTAGDGRSHGNFNGFDVVYPVYGNAGEQGFNPGTPMFVPLAKNVQPNPNYTKNGSTPYFQRGYWTKYSGGTGYSIDIFFSKGGGYDKSVNFVAGATPDMPYTATVDLSGGTTLGFKVHRANNIYYYTSTDVTMSNASTAKNLTFDSGATNQTGITTTAAGDYVFTLTCAASGELQISVKYPVAAGDYRVLYKDGVHTGWKPSAVVPKVNNGKDTVSFFIRPGSSPQMKIQQASIVSSTLTWNDYSTISDWVDNAGTNALSKDSVYNICLTMNGSGGISVGNVEAYTGNFYIRTDAANNKWDNYKAADHMMTYSEYSEHNSDFSHYWMAHVTATSSNKFNVKYVVANDYSPCISDTLIQSTYRGGDSDHVNESGYISAEANIRFMWKRSTNEVYRAYLAPAQSDGSKFLVLRGQTDDNLLDVDGNALRNASNNNHLGGDYCMQFVDNENWIYETTVKVIPSSYVKLFALFDEENFYYKGANNNTFNGSDSGDGYHTPNAIQLITGSGEAQLVRVIYDFKTDRLVAAYLPSGNITEDMDINADVMFIREHQGDIDQLTFNSGKKLTDVKTAYGVIRFNKWTLNNKEKTGSHTPLASPLSRYERDLFYISFPFRVNLNEVFGFGTYGVHWILEYYDGAGRAEKGFWKDSPTFWKFVTNRNGFILEPNVGYLLALDLDQLGEESAVWNNRVENVELFFPSTGNIGSITSTSVTHNLPQHECTIIRPTPQGDRHIADSHWNIMSVPTYVNVNNPSFTNTTWTATIGPKFLYTWNADDNTLTPTTAAGFNYHAMHAYTVQYYGNVTWTASTTSPIVARKLQEPSAYEWCLELQQNDKMIDRTYVRMSDEEEVTTGFEFGYDMSKSIEWAKANIYTFIGTEWVAGNSLPLETEQTTIIPVGLTLAAAGDYTFAMPAGTHGVGVTLVDTQTNERTNLSAGMTQTVTLTQGDHLDRFFLEISPIHNTPTDIGEVTGNGLPANGARKVLIDGILYIVKGDKLYDVRGTMIK